MITVYDALIMAHGETVGIQRGEALPGEIVFGEAVELANMLSDEVLNTYVGGFSADYENKRIIFWMVKKDD